MGQRIAIIGSGISGLGAAWALHRSHDITVFESEERIGGHSNTVDVATPRGPIAVDTGFIVYNEVTYPNLTRLFAALGVETQLSDMSFSYSLDRKFEYGASLAGILAKPSNLVRPGFARMLVDIDRFRRTGSHLAPTSEETIDDLLGRHGFSAAFREDYLYPMTGAIWSARQAEISRYPARSILDFLGNHGLIEIKGRPGWRTVTGGSREYVSALVSPFADRIRTGSAVRRVVRMGREVLVESAMGAEMFDQVILATHSDQSSGILGDDASDIERSLLGSIRYEPNTAVLHSDPELMPRNERVWASWNAMSRTAPASGGPVSVTYWMNRLQTLDPSFPLFLSLNPSTGPREDLVHAGFEYAHPQFDAVAIEAQAGLAAIQGTNRTWFAGAYLGYGFHEDGLQSGLNVAAALGSPAPWHGTFHPASSAPPVASVVR